MRYEFWIVMIPVDSMRMQMGMWWRYNHCKICTVNYHLSVTTATCQFKGPYNHTQNTIHCHKHHLSGWGFSFLSDSISTWLIIYKAHRNVQMGIETLRDYYSYTWWNTGYREFSFFFCFAFADYWLWICWTLSPFISISICVSLCRCRSHNKPRVVLRISLYVIVLLCALYMYKCTLRFLFIKEKHSFCPSRTALCFTANWIIIKFSLPLWLCIWIWIWIWIWSFCTSRVENRIQWGYNTHCEGLPPNHFRISKKFRKNSWS